jgi:subtilisin family serine protease
VEPQLYNDFARRLLGIDGPAASPAPPLLSQDGSGQIVAVADTGIDDQHPDFQGRIVGKVARGRAGDTSDPHGHGTHVSGSVLGDGTASGGQIRGVAPKAKLFFQSLLDASGKLGGLPVDLNELFQEAYDAGARIHNNSWGADLGSTYTMNSEEVDEFIHAHPDMLVVIAAGNAGIAVTPRKSAKGFVDWLSIGSPASCKNALTVGASRSNRSDGPLSTRTWGSGWPAKFPDPPISTQTVSGDDQGLAAFSSRGPCDDRRIKPDVVAPGTDIASTRSSLATKFWGLHPNPQYAFDGGTSMATPLVAGCAALVRQYYTDTRHVAPSAALLKATLINSTVWLTGGDATAPSAGTPNYHQGHGRVNMQRAIPNPSQPGLALQFVDTWKTPGAALSSTGARRRYQLVLPAGVPELRLCLAYTDAPARGLQNNLSLIVALLGSSQKWMGNEQIADALLLPDPDNNVETVRIAQPPAGTYLIQVFAANLLKPPQDFALVVTGAGIPALTQI